MSNIGIVEVNLDQNIDLAGVGSVITVAGSCQDARTKYQLIVPSRNLEVFFCVKERIINLETGTVATIPEEDNWEFLHRNEYDMEETLQNKDDTSTVPWTFRFQPTRERLPLFPQVGIYEMMFKFVTQNSSQDDIRLNFVVYVGNPVSPRRAEL